MTLDGIAALGDSFETVAFGAETLNGAKAVALGFPEVS